MHAGRIETSKPLQAVLSLLQSRGPQGATTWEFIEIARVANPATEISALRHNGYSIERKCEGKNNNGRTVNRYFLLDSPIVQGQLFAEAM